MNPRTSRNWGETEPPIKGILMWLAAKYQFAPAETKNAPDRNLQASFQNVDLFTVSEVPHCLRLCQI